MKRTAIITFHRALNYGAILQAYALQETLRFRGKPSELIDYRCAHLESIYKPFSFAHCTSIAGKIKKCLKSGQFRKKRKQFDRFTRRYLHTSRPCDAYNVEVVAGKYENIITGSDQVFSLEATGGDLNYYLPFCRDNQRKYAYAASFGSDHIDPRYAEEAMHLLESFDEISVRERTGAMIVREALKRKATVALDPTLLLSGEQWAAVAKAPKKHPEKYILVYMMDGGSLVLDKAFACAQELSCDIVILNPTLKQQLKHRDCWLYPTASPEEFVWLFQNAEKVVTNSFHGTAFSLIFQRDFYVEISNIAKGSRIADLLTLLRLEDRLIPGDTDENVNWERVDRYLSMQREESLRFIDTMG